LECAGPTALCYIINPSLSETAMLGISILILICLSLIAAFVAFDCLVRTEYEWHKMTWKEDGQPHGFFWIPSEVKLGIFIRPESSRAMRRCSAHWLFLTPLWIRGNARATRILYMYRLFVLLGNLPFLLLVIMAFLKK
jgi:hypothetical protein